MANIANYVGVGGEKNLEEFLATRDKFREINLQRGAFTKPLTNFNLDDHLGLNGRQATGEHVTRGTDLLLSYRRIVGHESFKNFVYDTNKIKQARELTNEDISKNMLLYTPDKSKAEVAKMYNDAVYDVKR